MWLLVYGMSVNVNGIQYVHVSEQACWARSAGNSATENVLLLYTECVRFFRVDTGYSQTRC